MGAAMAGSRLSLSACRNPRDNTAYSMLNFYALIQVGVTFDADRRDYADDAARLVPSACVCERSQSDGGCDYAFVSDYRSLDRDDCGLRVRSHRVCADELWSG